MGMQRKLLQRRWAAEQPKPPKKKVRKKMDTLADRLVKLLEREYGGPESLTSTQKREFKADVIEELASVERLSIEAKVQDVRNSLDVSVVSDKQN